MLNNNVRQTLRARKEFKEMEIVSLDDYPLLAVGGESKIYQFDSTRILRVPQRQNDFDRIRYEYKVYNLVQDKICAPKVYEIVTYKDTPCLLMDRIDGCDLYSGIGRNIFRIVGIPKKLARLHSELLKIPGSEVLETNHGKAKYYIENSGVLSPEVKGKLLSLLTTLDGGKTLCHGDFHPGNIIGAAEKSYIIDWSSATTGSPLFDIAHTYLLLINTPRLAGVSDKLYRLQRRVTRYIGKKYIKVVCRENKLSIRELLPYILIKAGERTYYGMESEKEWLGTFIRNTLDRKEIDILHLERFA